MPEHNLLVSSYVHLGKERRADEALHTLKKVASLVKPIMRDRGWKVGQLAEFYPQEPSLLGILNVDRGSKICLRLRHPGDRNQFLPLDNVVDTMLHELCHNVHGPHNERFHALWDELRDDLQGLMMKGYTGEGFLSQSRHLGGARMPEREARRLAREAAEKRSRQPVAAAAGRRLGGPPPQPGQDIRKTIADAVERRNKVLEGCAAEKLSDRQMREVVETATRNGFRTQAEEDEANDVAIAQALAELAQEEEARLGQANAPPLPERPEGYGGGSAVPDRTRSNDPEAGREAASSRASSATVDGETQADEPSFWTCETCTLHNPLQYLCCDACGAERGVQPKRPRRAGGASGAAGPGPTTIDLTRSPPPRDRERPGTQPAPPTWMCKFCGRQMERQWWTCATCGWMKDSSR